MKALKESWVAHPHDRKEIHTYLSRELRQIDPSGFNSNSKTKYPKRDSRVSCSLYLEDMVCNGLGIEKKIYVDGDRKCKVVK